MWEKWNRTDGPKYPHEKIIQFTFRNFPDLKCRKISKALDMGCGNGVNSIFLAQEGFDLSAVDITKSGIAITQDRLNKLGLPFDDIRVASVHQIPYDDNSFDLLISAGVFDSMDPALFPDVVKEIYRLLKPGGKGIFMFMEEGHFNLEGDNPWGLTAYSEETVESMFNPFNWQELNIDYYRTTFKNKTFWQKDFLVTLIR